MNNILKLSKNLGMKHNVSFRVIDKDTREVVATHVGHNAATNSMLLGIAHYLVGDGIFNQAPSMLINYVPKFISLGTMGLFSQDQDADGLPAGIGETAGLSEEERFKEYMYQVPGYGADGYDMNSNNGRLEFGLGPMFKDRLGGQPTPGKITISTPGCDCTCEGCLNTGSTSTEISVLDTRPSVGCELISLSHPRVAISFRDIVPEYESEISETIDVVFSAMISTGALAQFREPGRDYIFITEAGLWARRDWEDSGENGLLAAYRIAPPNSDNWDMEVPSNRDILKQNILRVGKNQVVQVIWKIQIGSVEQLNSTVLHPEPEKLRWLIWNGSDIPEPEPEPSIPSIDDKYSYSSSKTSKLNLDDNYSASYSIKDSLRLVDTYSSSPTKTVVRDSLQDTYPNSSLIRPNVDWDIYHDSEVTIDSLEDSYESSQESSQE